MHQADDDDDDAGHVNWQITNGSLNQTKKKKNL